MQKIIDKALKDCWEYRTKSTPNPTVYACVINDTHEIIADGMTEIYPGKHAEPIALAKAGEKARGSTLFVTLEPCSHHGKNPPCTDAIIKAGIRHVIYALNDPFLNGMGIKSLNDAGIKTTQIDNSENFTSIYQGFFNRIKNNQPYIIHKIALNGDKDMKHPDDRENNRPVWITGKESRQDVHLWRSRSDTIVSSLKSIQDDQSQLDIRMGIISHKHPNIIALSTNSQKYKDDIQRLKSTHKDRHIYTLNETNLSSFTDLKNKINSLKINNLYIEVGEKLSTKMIDASLADEYHIYSPNDKYCNNPLYLRLLSQSLNISVTKHGTDTKITMKKSK